MDTFTCKLCEKNPAIKASHIIPAFVFRAVKSNSATGYMRRPSESNVRMQDGDKHPILREDCEQLFSRREVKFNNHVFKAFHESDLAEFEYGDWFHYFLTSITWRTLIMELADSTTVGSNAGAGSV